MRDGRAPLILSIETATRTGSVAVTRGDEILASRAGDPHVSHSTNLIEMIRATLNDADVSLAQIDLFAVAEGPGSFTGLRIGLATAKALAVSMKRRIVGVSTLAAIAHASGGSGAIVSLLQAGRGEVFAQLFSVNDGHVKAEDGAAHLSPKALLARYELQSRLTWTGEGVGVLREHLQSIGRGHEWFLAATSHEPARSVSVLAFREFQEGKSTAPEELRAVYVRAADAEINERWQQKSAQ